jgi:hypothetical protein
VNKEDHSDGRDTVVTRLCIWVTSVPRNVDVAYNGLRLRKIANSLIEEPIHPVEPASLRRNYHVVLSALATRGKAQVFSHG